MIKLESTSSDKKINQKKKNTNKYKKNTESLILKSKYDCESISFVQNNSPDSPSYITPAVNSITLSDKNNDLIDAIDLKDYEKDDDKATDKEYSQQKNITEYITELVTVFSEQKTIDSKTKKSHDYKPEWKFPLGSYFAWNRRNELPITINRRNTDTKLATKKKKIPWQNTETFALIAGVEDHGPGNWKKILNDKKYSIYFTKNNRNNISLKDRWVTLDKMFIFPAVEKRVEKLEKKKKTDKKSHSTKECSDDDLDKETYDLKLTIPESEFQFNPDEFDEESINEYENEYEKHDSRSYDREKTKTKPKM